MFRSALALAALAYAGDADTLTSEQYKTGQPAPALPAFDPSKPYTTVVAPPHRSTKSYGMSVAPEQPMADGPVPQATSGLSTKPDTSQFYLVTPDTSQFDLVCTSLFTYLNEKWVREAPTINFELRIDLSSGRYCDGNCTKTAQLDSVSDTKISVKREKFGNGRAVDSLRIGLESGGFTEVIRQDSDQETEIVGQCEIRPFSGFP